MYHNQPPPVTAPPSQYASQDGEKNQPSPASLAPPSYIQQPRDQVQVASTPISQEAMIGYIARIAATVTAFLATVIIGTAKQSIGAFYINYTVKYSLFSAFKYFLAVNIIVFIYSIASLLMSILIKSKPVIVKLSVTIADVVLVSMLLTANGAASAISAQLDNIDHLNISSTCDKYGKICSHVKGSIAMSMLAAGLYLGLIIFTLVTFAKKRN